MTRATTPDDFRARLAVYADRPDDGWLWQRTQAPVRRIEIPV